MADPFDVDQDRNISFRGEREIRRQRGIVRRHTVELSCDFSNAGKTPGRVLARQRLSRRLAGLKDEDAG